MSVTITNIVEELQSRIDALTANDSNSDLLKLFSAVKISSEQVIRGYDNVSDLPAATSNNKGYIYWVNNQNSLYVSDGQNWSSLSTGGGSVYYAGSNIDITNNTITNTAPDQTVTLTGDSNLTVTGTYPNFTLSNTAPDQTVTLTGGSNVTISGTYPNFTISSTDNVGIALTNLSVTQNAASGGGSLAYDNTTGNFSFTPPDLSNLQGGSGGIQLTNLAVTQNTASGTGTLTYDNTTGNFTYTPPELFSGDYADLTNKPTNLSDFVNDVGYITSQTDSQTLSLVGTTLSITNGNNVDLSGLAGSASVSISDSTPFNPTAGDLWWKSDEGILKIYYTDSDSSQWVDTVPQIASGSSYSDTDVETYLNGNLATHIIPDTNAAYDIGSAEYKIRHFYLSSNSMYMGDNEVSIGLTDDKLTVGGHYVAESSHANVDNAGAIDITKTNHLITPLTAGVSLPNGTYIGQELKFWISQTVGNDYIDIIVDNAKYMNGSGILVTAAAYNWRLQATNTAMFNCLWDGTAWILSNGSIGA